MVWNSSSRQSHIHKGGCLSNSTCTDWRWEGDNAWAAMRISLQLSRFFRQKEERFHGSHRGVAWFETSWNVIPVSYHYFSNAYKTRGGRSRGWAHRHSTVPGVFVCLHSEGLCCFCIGHTSAASLGDIYEKRCALDSSGITFWCRDMKHSLRVAFPFYFEFNV